MDIEIWKDIPNYEGLYQVSSFGRVKSLLKHHGTSERILKQCRSTVVYLIVRLCDNGRIKTFTVHSLVAMAFHGHKPDGTNKICVDHIDNNPLNNRADNLSLISNRENSNKDKKGYSSEFIGVSWNKRQRKWKVNIKFNESSIYLGSFDLELDAAKAYQKALGELNAGLDLDILYPKKKTNTSKFIGVSFNKSKKKWKAMYKFYLIGYFDTELEANEARENYISTIIKTF